MPYILVYTGLKCAVWITIHLLPVEAFNKLCMVLPGRLIVYGLRYYGASIGRDVTLTPPIIFHNFSDKARYPFSRLSIGNHCYFGRDLFVDLKDHVVIADKVTLAMGVSIITHTDVAQSPLKMRYFPSTQAPVHIGRGAYIGARATLLQGLTLGECAVLAAGAVATQTIPSFCIYGGVPARVIRKLEE